MSAITGTPACGSARNWVPSTVLLVTRCRYFAPGRAAIDAADGT